MDIYILSASGYQALEMREEVSIKSVNKFYDNQAFEYDETFNTTLPLTRNNVIRLGASNGVQTPYGLVGISGLYAQVIFNKKIYVKTIEIASVTITEDGGDINIILRDDESAAAAIDNKKLADIDYGSRYPAITYQGNGNHNVEVDEFMPDTSINWELVAYDGLAGSDDLTYPSIKLLPFIRRIAYHCQFNDGIEDELAKKRVILNKCNISAQVRMNIRRSKTTYETKSHWLHLHPDLYYYTMGDYTFSVPNILTQYQYKTSPYGIGAPVRNCPGQAMSYGFAWFYSTNLKNLTITFPANTPTNLVMISPTYSIYDSQIGTHPAYSQFRNTAGGYDIYAVGDYYWDDHLEFVGTPLAGRTVTLYGMAQYGFVLGPGISGNPNGGSLFNQTINLSGVLLEYESDTVPIAGNVLKINDCVPDLTVAQFLRDVCRRLGYSCWCEGGKTIFAKSHAFGAFQYLKEVKEITVETTTTDYDTTTEWLDISLTLPSTRQDGKGGVLTHYNDALTADSTQEAVVPDWTTIKKKIKLRVFDKITDPNAAFIYENLKILPTSVIEGEGENESEIEGFVE